MVFPATSAGIDRLYTERIQERLNAAPGSRPSGHATEALGDVVGLWRSQNPGEDLPDHLAHFGEDRKEEEEE